MATGTANPAREVDNAVVYGRGAAAVRSFVKAAQLLFFPVRDARALCGFSGDDETV